MSANRKTVETKWMNLPTEMTDEYLLKRINRPDIEKFRDFMVMLRTAVFYEPLDAVHKKFHYQHLI